MFLVSSKHALHIQPCLANILTFRGMCSGQGQAPNKNRARQVSSSSHYSHLRQEQRRVPTINLHAVAYHIPHEPQSELLKGG